MKSIFLVLTLLVLLASTTPKRILENTPATDDGTSGSQTANKQDGNKGNTTSVILGICGGLALVCIIVLVCFCQGWLCFGGDVIIEEEKVIVEEGGLESGGSEEIEDETAVHPQWATQA